MIASQWTVSQVGLSIGRMMLCCESEKQIKNNNFIPKVTYCHGK